jgi:hypothetical protein
MKPPLTVTIQGPRGDEWERVCGTRTFPVTTWEPVRADLPGKPNAEVWMLNLQALDSQTLVLIIAYLRLKFGGTLAEVEAAVAAHGIPILAEDAYVALNDPQRWVG